MVRFKCLECGEIVHQLVKSEKDPEICKSCQLLFEDFKKPGAEKIPIVTQLMHKGKINGDDVEWEQNRIALLPVGHLFMLSLFSVGKEKLIELDFPLEKPFIITDVDYHSHRRAFVLSMSSPHFDIVPEGAEIPVLFDMTITAKEHNHPDSHPDGDTIPE